jgi:Cation transporter/ATPase, N-terminus
MYHLFCKLETDPESKMTTEKTEKSLALYGPNVLNPPMGMPSYMKLLGECTNFSTLVPDTTSLL